LNTHVTPQFAGYSGPCPDAKTQRAAELPHSEAPCGPADHLPPGRTHWCLQKPGQGTPQSEDRAPTACGTRRGLKLCMSLEPVPAGGQRGICIAGHLHDGMSCDRDQASGQEAPSARHRTLQTQGGAHLTSPAAGPADRPQTESRAHAQPGGQGTVHDFRPTFPWWLTALSHTLSHSHSRPGRARRSTLVSRQSMRTAPGCLQQQPRPSKSAPCHS